MANEIAVSANLSVGINGVTSSLTASKTANFTGPSQFQNVQAVGIAAEQLDLGEATFTCQYIMLKNLDATNFVQVALDSGVSTQIFGKLMPGDFMLLPPQTSTLYLKANTAPCNVAVEAIGT